MTDTADDPDSQARRALARYRAAATAILVLMAVLMLATYALPPGYWTNLLQASAKAGVVGGLADWFAVTALFRRPLGLPIPHTAIIPRQQERLARGMGRFVAAHVLNHQELSRIVARLDLSGLIAGYLSDPAAVRPAAEALAGMLPRLLGTLEDGRARRLARRLLPRLLASAGASQVFARALRALVEGGRHQEMLGFILAELRSGLLGREGALKRAIEERVREQGGRIVGWALGAQIAQRVLGTVNAELDRMGPDGSDMRLAFDEWVRREIARLETDPARAAELAGALRNLATHPTVLAWAGDVWDRAKAALAEDAARPDGRTAVLLEQSLANMGTLLSTDPAARARMQRAIEAVVANVLPAAQGHVADVVAEVIRRWDPRTLVDRLETRVGKDLQYVRVNGTLVGFLVGGALYAGLLALFGRVAG